MDPAPELPRAPLNLWPEVPPSTATHATGKLLTVEVPIFAERPLLTALARSIHFEMTAAGEWAARGGEEASPQNPRQREARRLSQRFAEEAARMFSLYTAVYQSVRETSEYQLAPDVLQEHATTTYRRAIRNERENLQRSSSPYNDSLYASVKPGAPKPGPKHRHP